MIKSSASESLSAARIYPYTVPFWAQVARTNGYVMTSFQPLFGLLPPPVTLYDQPEYAMWGE